MASALSGLGSATPLSRAMDAIQGATKDTTWQEVLSKVMGGVPIDEIAKSDIVVKGMTDAITASNAAERDAGGVITAKGQATRDDNARLISALRQGGAAARAELERRSSAGTLTKDVENQLVEAIKNGGVDARLEKKGFKWGEAVDTGAYAGLPEDEAAFFAAQGNASPAGTPGFSSEDSAVVSKAGEAADRAMRERKTGAGGAAGGAGGKVSLTGTLTLIDGTGRSQLTAEGVNDPSFTPVVGEV